MIGFTKNNQSHFLFSIYYRDIFIYSVIDNKLVETFKTKIETDNNSHPNHGICFEGGENDHFEKIIVFGQGFIKRCTLKY